MLNRCGKRVIIANTGSLVKASDWRWRRPHADGEESVYRAMRPYRAGCMKTLRHASRGDRRRRLFTLVVASLLLLVACGAPEWSMLHLCLYRLAFAALGQNLIGARQQIVP